MRIRRPGVDTADQNVFHREGEYWSVVFQGQTIRLRDLKGLRYLARLLASPGRDFHVLEMVADATGGAVEIDGTVEAGLTVSLGLDAGPLLDAQAKKAYRRRLAEIDEDGEDARVMGDHERAAQAEAERDFLVHELARAVGLGGRDRSAASMSERARASVTRAVRQAMAHIQKHHPVLGEHLERTIRTGTYCSYLPDPQVPIGLEAVKIAGQPEGGGVSGEVSADGETITVHIPLTFRKRGGRKLVVTPDGAVGRRARGSTTSWLRRWRGRSGIDPIGLGQPAGRFGEASGLARVDLGERQTSRRQGAFEAPVIGAGRLEDDAADRQLANPVDQGPVPGPLVAEPLCGPVRPAMRLKMVLRDVDADGSLRHLFRIPRLSCEPSGSGIRSGPEEKDGGDPTLARPSYGLGFPDPTPASARHKCRAGRRLQLSHEAGKIIRQGVSVGVGGAAGGSISAGSIPPVLTGVAEPFPPIHSQPRFLGPGLARQ